MHELNEAQNHKLTKIFANIDMRQADVLPTLQHLERAIPRVAKRPTAIHPPSRASSIDGVQIPASVSSVPSLDMAPLSTRSAIITGSLSNPRNGARVSDSDIKRMSLPFVGSDGGDARFQQVLCHGVPPNQASQSGIPPAQNVLGAEAALEATTQRPILQASRPSPPRSVTGWAPQLPARDYLPFASVQKGMLDIGKTAPKSISSTTATENVDPQLLEMYPSTSDTLDSANPVPQVRVKESNTGAMPPPALPKRSNIQAPQSMPIAVMTTQARPMAQMQPCCSSGGSNTNPASLSPTSGAMLASKSAALMLQRMEGQVPVEPKEPMASLVAPGLSQTSAFVNRPEDPQTSCPHKQDTEKGVGQARPRSSKNRRSGSGSDRKRTTSNRISATVGDAIKDDGPQVEGVEMRGRRV